ncbi:MAG TPA: DUF3800 domain-containing protein [Rhizomicrobium sp.]|jgi:hypothetical protein
MHFVYIDDSKDTHLACFSALLVPADKWRASLDWIITLRQQMKVSDGIYVRKELHATKWNSGRGRIAPYPIDKQRRVQLFDFFLAGIAMIPEVQLINAASQLASEERTFERMLNRINVNMQKSGSTAVIFCDQGKNYDSLLRKLRVYNPIMSKFGAWPDGSTHANLKLERILEDLVYRDSRKSLFIQAADCCAYALLRREHQIPSKTALGLHQSLMSLVPIMVTAANKNDPLGIVR